MKHTFLVLILWATGTAALAAAPARIAVLGMPAEHGKSDIRSTTALVAADATLEFINTSAEMVADQAPARFDLVLTDATWDAAAKETGLAEIARNTRLLVLAPTAALTGNIPLTEHPWITEYWSNPSVDNHIALVRYLVNRVLARDVSGEIQPPITYGQLVYHHPDATRPFASLADYLAWYRHGAKHRFDPEALTIGITFSQPLLTARNHAHVDALIQAAELRGANVVVVASRGGLNPEAFLDADGTCVVDAIITNVERLDLNNYQAGLASARKLGVPLLSAFNLPKMDAAAYAASLTGLHPERTQSLINNERDGVIEPIVIGGRGAPRLPDGSYIDAFPAQIQWRVDRALSWAKLRRAANSTKRVAFTYWSEGGGKANVGGDPDDFLDVPDSLVRLLTTMKARGFDTGTAPLPERDALTTRMARESSNVGTWAPGELEARVKNAEVALIPEDTYRAWFAALPAIRQAEIVEMWGPPPGNVMTHTDADGKRFLVIPKMEFGNILIAPHPDWGYLQDNKALMSAGALPPHHQYLAFFLWLQREWTADAWVSMFSNIVLQPGKSEGPAVDDHIGILLGSLPHIHPERLGASGGIGNKRKGMAQLPGWYNIVVPSDAAEQLFELRAQLARYDTQPDPTVRTESEPILRAEVARVGLERALEIDAATEPFDSLHKKLSRYLDDLERAHMPFGSKVLGSPPEGKALPDMVAGMLGADLRKALAPLTPSPSVAARALVAAVVLDGRTPAEALAIQLGRSSPEAEQQLTLALDYANRLRTAPREIAGILDALEGRWLEPGPMDEPMRRPDSLPPGRTLYNFDQTAIPTIEAEAVGVRQAEALIAAHREKHDGAYPTKMAFVLWSGEIAKNNGVTEAQILHLLGARARRNERGEVTGVVLIPREELGRPRVDVLVTTSGAYRDHFQDKVELITEAVKLASASPETDNPVAAATRANEEKLRASGDTSERATALARARVFSPAPNAYSPSIQFLAKSGDQRGDEARMADLYTRRLSHAYGGGLYGEAARATFEQNLSTVDAATLPRSSNVNGLLDHPMSAGFLGGLNLAAKTVTGRDVDLYVSNLRNADDVSIESAARALQTELRTRYFNPKFLSEMKAHGYDGARNMMFMTDHLDLWDSTATNMVSSADWAEVKAVYVDDKLGLQLDQFFDHYNPHAQQVLLANLLGAASRGHWEASAADLEQVARRLARSAADHGAVCEAGVCRNEPLTKFIEQALANAPDAAQLMNHYREAIDKVAKVAADLAPAPSVAPAPTPSSAAPVAATPPAPAAAPTVEGRVIEEMKPPSAQDSTIRQLPWLWLGLVGTALALFAFGWLRPTRQHA
jgi:cobaltochelatase CobN